MYRLARIRKTLCVVIASSSAFAAPYAFKITCKDPARMRHVGEETEFRIQCTDLRKAGVGGEVEVRLDNFGTKTIVSRKVDPAKENPIVLKGTLDEPGFLRAAAFNPGVAETPFGLGKGNECASVGYEPEKIRPGFPRPADFDTYWQGERERLRRDVPIDVRREPLSAKERKGFKLWKVSFATFGGKRVWGWLSVPDDGSKGPWPLKVNVPGAGPAFSEAQATTAAGVVTLVMNVHPFEPARTHKEQDAKYKAQDKRLVAKYGVTYATAGIAVSREECFFHDAILGIDRAVDWAAALPEVDRSRVWYYGGSQGGGFGMYLMGLNKNFTKGCVWVCALADHGGYRVGRMSGWPRMVARSGDEAARKVAERYAPYFDACHFAPLVKVPVRMTAGLSDVCCPPPSVWSAYNSLGTTDKKIVPCPGVGHYVPGGLRAQQHRWLAQGTSCGVKFKVRRIGNARTEACAVADFNNDGRLDVIAGPYLYLAPEFRPIKVREVKTNVKEDGKGYADDFMNLPLDVNGDGRTDVISGGWFSKETCWAENALPSTNVWTQHLIDRPGNIETGLLVDIDGDGKATDLLPDTQHTCLYTPSGEGLFARDAVDGTRCDMGRGCGDLNGDGLNDVLTPVAWYEQLPGRKWRKHPLNIGFSDGGRALGHASNLIVYDVNRDGRADVLVSSAHKHGIFWWEQLTERAANGELRFKKHVIDDTWTQAHYLGWADIDGDAIPELIAGKRFMAHNGHDPDPYGTLGVYYYDFVPGSEPVFTKHVITYNEGIGAGMNIVPVDIDGDGDVDLVTTGKWGGPVIFENMTKNPAREF